MATKADIEKSLKKVKTDLAKVKAEKALDTSTLEHGEARRIINTYITEYVVTDDFGAKVRKHASQEIDTRILNLLKGVAGIAIGTAIALLVTFLITGKFK